MTKEILSLAPTMSSISLVGSNIKKSKKKDMKVKDFSEMGVKNLVGIELIKLQSNALALL